MLSYAYQVLNEQGYKSIHVEKFDNMADLCAAILAKGINSQIKRGLGKEYISHSESLSSLRGKIDITASNKNQVMLKKQMICIYDEFSINTYMNRIIKATIELLLRSDISRSRKKDLRRVFLYFEDVESIDLYTINWSFQFNRNNQTYRMLLAICYLVLKGLLQSKSEGTTRLMDFLDQQRMYKLFERFIFEYYRKHFPQITVKSTQIDWQLDDDFNALLPIMQTDIMLTYDDKTLIIDAKYYEQNMQEHYDAKTLYSNHLYQIFTYVKNKDFELRGKSQSISGMLLYARTDKISQPDASYSMSGNRISVKTLDLACNFEGISRQLNDIVENHFGIVTV